VKGTPDILPDILVVPGSGQIAVVGSVGSRPAVVRPC
jgi:hypothetical protein